MKHGFVSDTDAKLPAERQEPHLKSPMITNLVNIAAINQKKRLPMRVNLFNLEFPAACNRDDIRI